MTRRVGAKGQVVIPKEIRDALGIAPGDEVVFVADGNEVRVRRAGGLRALAGAFAGSKLRQELEAEHQRELDKEARRETQVSRRRRA